MAVTTVRTFIGANIKGTPAMSAQAVRHDVKALAKEGEIIALQEFRWTWYWKVLSILLKGVWGSYPAILKGISQPVLGAQGILWNRTLLKRKRAMVSLLHPGAAGISEDRYLRAVLLNDRPTNIKAWYGSTHPVVGGDQAGDSERRKGIMRHDLDQLDRFLGRLVKTGYAVVFEMDGNIADHGWAHDELMAIFKKYGAKIHGTHGIEWLITIDGKYSQVEVLKDWVVPTSKLNTDHEARCIEHQVHAA